jgi:hypothetical protein
MENLMAEEKTEGKNNKAGRYVHKDTGAVVNLRETPGVGTPMIDAFIQVGYVKEDEKVEKEPELETPKKK